MVVSNVMGSTKSKEYLIKLKLIGFIKTEFECNFKGSKLSQTIKMMFFCCTGDIIYTHRAVFSKAVLGLNIFTRFLPKYQKTKFSKTPSVAL